ncbi:response regulator [Paenibacillus sonchi]|uniref:response regulator n=1 Tax=Paenibacillus sonchi TaxID=373687 RepID=UPI002D7E96D2|nr:response regulator [Paenibacillus sonchi]
MNVLLVDDDYYVVAALQKKMDWTALGIEAVYTANNVAQAREIVENHSVQILISDIEMPQGSGLSLLAWIRDNDYPVQTILLTNYADFNYAQKAIELQSFEYFLKPIEFDKLMLIIQKAVARAKEQQHNEKAIQEGYYWQKNQSKNLEHFWRRMVSGSSSSPSGRRQSPMPSRSRISPIIWTIPFSRCCSMSFPSMAVWARKRRICSISPCLTFCMSCSGIPASESRAFWRLRIITGSPS